MLPGFMIKLLSQHRVLYCYLILSVWIFLMVGGMYKYIGTEDGAQGYKHSSNDIFVRGFPKDLKPEIKGRRIYRLCNPPEDINLGSEGQVDDNYTLVGAVIFLRHGDRGPLMHVRNISSVNCAGDLLSPDITNGDWDAGYAAYEAFLQNASLAAGLGVGGGGSDKLSNNFLWQLLGPFHAFPLVPPSSGECSLGQLTPVGVTQLLRTGHILKTAYADKLGIGSLTAEDVVVYSTHYRRTFQSALAFLYSFLSLEDLHKVTLRPSQSLAFCFNDCACPAAEKYRHQVSVEAADHFRSHPAVMKLVRSAASIVYESPDKTLLSDPHALRDALLAYVCHGAPLPCIDIGLLNKEVCVRPEQVTSLFAYTEWEERLYVKSQSLKRSCLLRAYGLLRSVVGYLLKMVSEGKPRIVIYSGHDKTLQYLSGALGVIAETAAPHYASRLVLEVYRSRTAEKVFTGEPAGSSQHDDGPAAKDYFFRLVFNGRDLTNHVVCCRHGGSTVANLHFHHGTHGEDTDPGFNISSSSHRKNNSSYLCPIESIVRFLHDDYFVPFNASNYKDACTNHP
ncbi:2-phosphoxylose phosphatase 1 [Frankliniella fusca]|uniref:2-phosphoxylose phosphatase 1 n=1 Tax=Frankliniella fusca TaxID=407009 RepID=A0AAE1LRP3_9NEOP|nr:2-phosphoxylose phosphatase 1 [Frankliniella fusca]